MRLGQTVIQGMKDEEYLRSLEIILLRFFCRDKKLENQMINSVKLYRL